jgi:hypothetical protein
MGSLFLVYFPHKIEITMLIIAQQPTAMNLSSRAADKNGMSAIGADMRSEKIENARSAVIAIREQRFQHQEAMEGKLLANEMGLTELRKLVATWKGEAILLGKLEAVVLMKEKECKKTRKLVGEAINGWGSTSAKSKEKSVARRVAAHCA